MVVRYHLSFSSLHCLITSVKHSALCYRIIAAHIPFIEIAQIGVAPYHPWWCGKIMNNLSILKSKIIDHHEDENNQKKLSGLKSNSGYPRPITISSCLTIVTPKIGNSWTNAWNGFPKKVASCYTGTTSGIQTRMVNSRVSLLRYACTI